MAKQTIVHEYCSTGASALGWLTSLPDSEIASCTVKSIDSFSILSNGVHPEETVGCMFLAIALVTI